MSYRVRLAGAADVPLLAPLERAAAGRFATIGLERIAQGRPTSETEYRAAIAGGRLWVVVAEEGGPAVGLVIADLLDGEGFLAEIAVHPAHGGHRLAAPLIAAVADWAAGMGCRRLTLTTFRDVPWNRPYYERLGFRVLDEAAAGPGLRAVRDQERAHGVDNHGPRVCMVREIAKEA
jgi:GNAT superfamily N-acetyltransferase